MKIRKLTPLFATALLLVGCGSNSGTTKLKKPSFAKYAGQVTAEEFSKAYSEKMEGLMDLFETEGEGDAKTVKGLKNGLTISVKDYENSALSGKTSAGTKVQASREGYSEMTMKVDKTNQRANSLTKSESSMSYKNANITYDYYDSEAKLIKFSYPTVMNGSTSVSYKMASESQSEVVNGTGRSINVTEKTYRDQVLPSGYDWSKQMAQTAMYYYQSFAQNTFTSMPTYMGEEDVKYYVDADILTMVASKTFDGTFKEDGLEYTSKATVEYITQLDFKGLKFDVSYEKTIEESGKQGNLKLVAKAYEHGEYVNKDVTIKAVDVSKFVDLDKQ